MHTLRPLPLPPAVAPLPLVLASAAVSDCAPRTGLFRPPEAEVVLSYCYRNAREAVFVGRS